jgi:hypothetical protein
VESDQIDVLALAVLGDLEEINDSFEARGARQVWSDVVQTDRKDRLDLDFTLFHTVALAGRHVRAHPDSDAAGDFTASYSVTQTSCEDHLKPSTLAGACGGALMARLHRAQVCPTLRCKGRGRERNRVCCKLLLCAAFTTPMRRTRPGIRAYEGHLEDAPHTPDSAHPVAAPRAGCSIKPAQAGRRGAGLAQPQDGNG